MSSFDHEKIQQAVRMMLEGIGEDPDREGLLDTPKRVAKMYEEVFQGLYESPEEHLMTVFGEDHEELVLVKDIPFYSMCEHHLVPFYGHAHVGYIPKDGKVTGLSKLARTVEAVTRRPQLQERITSSVAEAIRETLAPHGVMVVVEAEHMCMTMRGVKKPGAVTVTSAVRGSFETDAAARSEVLAFLDRNSKPGG
ncbi:GTP cyclohydrolase I [Salsuginibacillus halophilus]|uniref:GTP cyclohydrolase 1 n=1 Tax=Salsuginibacillus halophilus TaxID=517424 RepID=A0A2P8HWD5_9BACI|nr:GTP cyclohydrolase I FolE [Salsuginibacillus halophilus]PSL50488.1 GTP cyclohydrolase I [Salsuginibacillus halophilus]